RIDAGNGRIGLRLLGTYVFDLTTIDSTGTSVDRAGMNGGPVSQPSGLPHFTGTADITYSNSALTLGLRARYVSKGVYDATLIGPHQKGYSPTLRNSIDDNKVNDYWLFDANIAYKIMDTGSSSVELFGTINNLFD